MAISAAFANPDNSAVNLWLDANSVRPGLSLDNPEVLEFLSGGGVIGPFVPPPPPPTPSEIDQAELNKALTEEGSVLRANMELTLIEVNKLRADHGRPPYTPAQYKIALKAQMRTP